MKKTKTIKKKINNFLDTMFVVTTIAMLIVLAFLMASFLCFIPPIPTNTIYLIVAAISMYLCQSFSFGRRRKRNEENLIKHKIVGGTQE